MSKQRQQLLGLDDKKELDSVEKYEFEPIKGYPMLRWQGKRPFTTTQYYPAQLKEVYGQDVDGWRNKIYWGDNLQVMSHLLKEYRGKINLVYIDPPFDSKADYKKSIELKGKTISNDHSAFEDKQYTDIWTNDEYLQYMYVRIILIKELLSDTGTLYLHCDYRKSHHLKCILDEIFGPENFVNEIVWCYEDIGSRAVNYFKRKHDSILMVQKTDQRKFNITRKGLSESTIKRFGSYFNDEGKITYRWLKENNPGVFKKLKGIPENLDGAWLDKNQGQPFPDWWVDISPLKSHFGEAVGYPTQKPEALLKRIIIASSDPGEIVFDCFMGSGTTQAVALRLGRRFIGADINLGAVQTTCKRLNELLEISGSNPQTDMFDEKDDYPRIGFEMYNVNNYDVFRNPIEARELLLDAKEVNKYPQGNIFDGDKDGWMVKIMPVNRIATRADLSELISGFDYKTYQKRQEKNPGKSVEKIKLFCMGHEPDLGAYLINEVKPLKIEVEVMDILRDGQDLQFKRDSEAKIVIKNGNLVIEQFYPMNLLQKLSLKQENVKDWSELVESVMVDWNYDGAVLEPTVVDIPEGDELVKGKYKIPEDVGTIRVKITDLLSESFEVEVQNA